MQQVTHWAPLMAGAAIGARRLVHVENDANDRSAIQGADSFDPLIGVSGSRAVKESETVEVAIAGIAEVEFGGAVSRGDLLTTDNEGKAVAIDSAGLTLVHADGAAADTDIAVAGIKTTDDVVGVAVTDGTVTGKVTIHRDGHIRAANTTAAKELIVAYRRKISIAGIALVNGVAGDIGDMLIAPGVK